LNESRLSALLLVTTLTIALVVVVGPQPQGSAEVNPSPSLFAALADPATSTTATFGASLDLAGTTTSTVLPRVDPPTTRPEKDKKKQSRETTTTTAAPAKTTTTAPENPTTTTTQPTTTTTQPGGSFNSSYENQFGSLINDARSDAGKSKLSRSGALDTEARKWAKKMAESGGLSHSDLGRFMPPWGSVGENVAYGGSVGSIFDNLYASDGHRNNMLGNFTHMGIGVWVDAGGLIWTCHVFAG
jgi:uncharacterized protein YkwD